MKIALRYALALALGAFTVHPAQAASPTATPVVARTNAKTAPTAHSTAGQLRVRVLARKPSQVESRSFDLDDNVWVLPTKIYVTNSATGKQHGFSTQEWAKAGEHFTPSSDGKSLVGSGQYKGYVMSLDDSSPEFGYRAFRDGTTLMNDVKKATDGPEPKWQGPMWQRLVEATSHPETARATNFISARGQSPTDLHNAFVYLQQKGYIRYVPPKSSFIPVAYGALRVNGKELTGSTAEKKAQAMTQRLDEVQHLTLGKTAHKVITPDGTGTRAMQLWEFSDDDYANFSGAIKALSEGVKAGRWPDVKITVRFTGKNHPTEKPHAVVLKGDGTTRPELPQEQNELVHADLN